MKKKVSVTLDEDIIEKLRERAEESDRSLSQYVNLLLKQRLDKNPLPCHRRGDVLK